MGKRLKYDKFLEEYYTKDNQFYSYKCKEITLFFYDCDKTDFFNSYKYHESEIIMTDKEAHILLSKKYFDQTLKEKVEVFDEMEDMLLEKRKPVRYLYFLLCYLSFLWIIWAFPGVIAAQLLEKLPFFIQIIGYIVFFGVSVLTPLIYYYKQKVYEHYYSKENKALIRFIKNKEYKEARKNYKNDFKDYNNISRYYIALGSHFRNIRLKVISIYLIIFLFPVILISLYAFTFDVSLVSVGSMFKTYFIEEPYLTSVYKTKYEFVTSIDRLDTPKLYNCGEYLCDSDYHTYSIYNTSLEKIDLSGFESIEEDEHYYLVENNYVLIYSTFIEDDKGYSFKLINLDTMELEFETTTLDTLGIGDNVLYFLDISSVMNTVYLSGTFHLGDDKFAVTYKIENNEIVDEYISENMFIDIEINDGYVYVFEYSSPELEIIKLDLNLDFVNSVELPGEYPRGIMKYDDTLYIKNGEYFMNSFYILNSDLTYDHVKDYVGFYTYVLIDDFLINNLGSFDSYREYDSEFNVTSKGLICDECSLEEIYSYKSYAKVDDILYAFGDEKIYVFEETDSYDYSLSVGVMNDGVGVILLFIGIGINTTLILSMKRKQKIIDFYENYFKEEVK